MYVFARRAAAEMNKRVERSRERWLYKACLFEPTPDMGRAVPWYLGAPVGGVELTSDNLL